MPHCRNTKGWCWLGLFVGLWTVGQAHAQWQVTDAVTHEGLDRINSTLKDQTNERLKDLYDQQRIGQASGTTGGDPEPPEAVLDKDRLSAVMESAEYGETTRCPQPRSEAKLPQDQWIICKEIVKTELAQYRYALAMREAVMQRQVRLKNLENARADLTQGDDTGKLHSNSNELLALMARLDTDQQQYRTYMDAYAARLQYLHSLRQALGEQAINGSLRAALIGAGAIEALDLALKAQQSQKQGDRSQQ
jgi:hypothetical protein